MNNEVRAFTKGVHNLKNPRNIPKDAASDSRNFITKDGRLVLVGGRKAIGDEGVAGGFTALQRAYNVAGTVIKYRKAGTKIQYWTGSTWTDCVTGLTTGAEYIFQNYSSLAGAFTIAIGIDGIWKFVNSHPTTPISMYNPGRNFIGKFLIDLGRTILWDRNDPNKKKDATGVYISFIDRQNSTVYTSVKAEAIGLSGSLTYTGTLAFKGNDSSGQAFTADNTTNIFTAAAHGFSSGDEVKLTTSGVLPTGLDISTLYFIQRISADTFYLIGSNGQIVDITANGSGTNTAFKNGSRRNCFGVIFQALLAAGLETFTESYNGVLVGSLGGTGTINYATGAYSVTFSNTTIGAVTSDYQWENSNARGILDFTYSATRQAGEGAQFPQDQGGDAILSILVGQDGSYYSLKARSSYRLALDADDTGADNKVYRIDIGIPFFRCAVSTNKGIMFMNTANPSKPEMTILQKNPIGDVVEPLILFSQFKFGDFNFDDAWMGTYDRWTMVMCKSANSGSNDIILMCNLAGQTVDIIKYSGRMAIQDEGDLLVGDSFSQTVYQIFNGYDDLGATIDSYWEGSTETFGTDYLKKCRKLRLSGSIGADQRVEIYEKFDGASYQLVGTIRGDGTYVDYSSTQSIGANFIGESQIGGESLSPAFNFYTELKLKTPKFQVRTIKLVPKGIGYFDLNLLTDFDILIFENRLPKAYRQKQKVSLDGLSTNQ